MPGSMKEWPARRWTHWHGVRIEWCSSDPLHDAGALSFAVAAFRSREFADQAIYDLLTETSTIH